MPAIAQDGDAVGHLQRFLERVRDEDHRNAPALEVGDQVEEILLLLRRQAGRGLIEDDDPRFVQHRAGNLDHLLLCRAEQADLRCRIDVELQRLHELLRGNIDAAQPVEEMLLSKEQILCHGHRRNQTGLLEHHRNAQLARLVGRLRIDDTALHPHLARAERDHTGHDLGQGRFAGAVLADDGMHFARHQREVDILDRRHACVFLRGLAQLQDRHNGDGRGAHMARLLSVSVIDRRSSRLRPWANRYNCSAHSTAATTPWCCPSKRLCSE